MTGATFFVVAASVCLVLLTCAICALVWDALR